MLIHPLGQPRKFARKAAFNTSRSRPAFQQHGYRARKRTRPVSRPTAAPAGLTAPDRADGPVPASQPASGQRFASLRRMTPYVVRL